MTFMSLGEARLKVFCEGVPSVLKRSVEVMVVQPEVCSYDLLLLDLGSLGGILRFKFFVALGNNLPI